MIGKGSGALVQLRMRYEVLLVAYAISPNLSSAGSFIIMYERMFVYFDSLIR